MTQKELLYMEDAIGHEQNIISICEDMLCDLNDDYLINYMKKEIGKHTSLQELLFKKLKEKSNE